MKEREAKKFLRFSGETEENEAGMELDQSKTAAESKGADLVGTAWGYCISSIATIFVVIGTLFSWTNWSERIE